MIDSGEEGQHNLIYWRSGDYIGIGPGAHGRYHTNKQRWATAKTKEPNSWLTKVKKLGSGEESSSILTKSDQDALVGQIYLQFQVKLAQFHAYQKHVFKYIPV